MLSLIASTPSLAVTLLLLKLAVLAFVVAWAAVHLGGASKQRAVRVPVKVQAQRR